MKVTKTLYDENLIVKIKSSNHFYHKKFWLYRRT